MVFSLHSHRLYIHQVVSNQNVLSIAFGVEQQIRREPAGILQLQQEICLRECSDGCIVKLIPDELSCGGWCACIHGCPSTCGGSRHRGWPGTDRCGIGRLPACLYSTPTRDNSSIISSPIFIFCNTTISSNNTPFDNTSLHTLETVLHWVSIKSPNWWTLLCSRFWGLDSSFFLRKKTRPMGFGVFTDFQLSK